MEEKETKKFISNINEVVLYGKNDEIFYKDFLKKEIIINGLLGEYNETGDYYLSSDISSDLVNAEKVITEKISDSKMTLEAQVGDFSFNFVLETEKVSARENVSELYLIEKVKSTNSIFERTLTTIVASYTDFNDIYFNDKIRKIFNIVDEKDTTSKDKNKEKSPLVLKRKQSLKVLAKVLSSQSEEFSKSYVYSLIKLLEQSGDAGQFIIRKLKRLMSENQKVFNKANPDYYTQVRYLLDTVMLTADVELPAKQKGIIDQLRKNVIAKDNILCEEKTNKSTAEEKKVVVAVDSSSGGGGKKNATKSVTINLPQNAPEFTIEPLSKYNGGTKVTPEIEAMYRVKKKLETFETEYKEDNRNEDKLFNSKASVKTKLNTFEIHEGNIELFK